MNTQHIKTKRLKKPLNKRFFQLSSAHFIYSDQDSEIEPLNTKSMSRQAIQDNVQETMDRSTEVRQDLSRTTTLLDRQSKLRIFDLTRLDPQEASDMQSQEDNVSASYKEARKTNINSKIGSDMLNEHCLRKALLSVHKSDYSADKFNITRSDEEIETVRAAKNLITDLRQLRENMFSLSEAENNLNQSVTDSSNSNQPKKSIVDDYSDFSTNMPDYGVGGSDE